MHIAHKVLLTAGTSALAPANTIGAWLRSDCADLVTTEPRAGGPPEWVPVEAGGDGSAALRAVEARLHAVPAVADPRRVSAEYSLCHALRTGRQLSSHPMILVVATDTFDGRLAAACVGHVLERDFNAHVMHIVVENFNVEDRAAFQLGLGRLLAQIRDQLRGLHPSTTCYAPIGGFKVMTSLAYLMGCVHGFPSVYLHEQLQVLHVVPAVPVNLSPEQLEPIVPALRVLQLVEAVTSVAELAVDAAVFVRFRWLFEEIAVEAGDGAGDADQGIWLNAIGHLVVEDEANESWVAPRLLLSRDAAAQLERHERVADELRTLVRLLRNATGGASTIYHEREWGAARGPGGWHLCKQPRGTFRATWRADPAAGAVVVDRIWLDHAAYERDAAAALQRPADPGPLHDVSASVYRVPGQSAGRARASSSR